METSLRLEHATVVVNIGTPEERKILDDVTLTMRPGEFITVLGSNGAGKSTLFNVIAGTQVLTHGKIYMNDVDVTSWSDLERTRYLARVFQDPKLGTAPKMTVAENLLLAQQRGQKRRLRLPNLRQKAQRRAQLMATAETMGNGLAKRLDVPTGSLSGGQRQTLSFLMATQVRPDLLLLDEHTAALDPKTSSQLMTLTNQRIREDALTALMITHNLTDAITYGDRLLVLENGRVSADVSGADKANLTLDDLLTFFNPY